MVPEADVCQPGAAGLHAQDHVVEERAHRAALSEHARGEVGDRKPESREQVAEGSVELVAEAAPPAQHDLVEEGILVQDDGLPQMDAQVLEGNRELMAGVQISECLGRWRGRALCPDPLQVLHRLAVHNASLEFFFCLTTQSAAKQYLDFRGVRCGLPERRRSVRARRRG